jgi:hypothetical protein
MATNEQIAKAFVLEYLKREPEFMDVVEFVDENNPDWYEDETDLYNEIHDLVVAELDTIAQRFADSED